MYSCTLRSFAKHQTHLDIVFRKLADAANGRFMHGGEHISRSEIDQHGVSPDPGGMAAILKFPASLNQKQLRQFLGKCNFYQRSILNYVSYTAPLLPLLNKGRRWKWAFDMETAFEMLRAKFANSYI
jgi:hypothetical protein